MYSNSVFGNLKHTYISVVKNTFLDIVWLLLKMFMYKSYKSKFERVVSKLNTFLQ